MFSKPDWPPSVSAFGYDLGVFKINWIFLVFYLIKKLKKSISSFTQLWKALDKEFQVRIKDQCLQRLLLQLAQHRIDPLCFEINDDYFNPDYI
jgi:hypothetical protein